MTKKETFKWIVQIIEDRRDRSLISLTRTDPMIRCRLLDAKGCFTISR